MIGIQSPLRRGFSLFLFRPDFLNPGQMSTGPSKVFICTTDGTIRTFKEEGVAGSVPVKDKDFTYSGDCEVIDDQDSNWRIKFLTSGTLVWLTIPVSIDAFLVGGGGGGICRGSETNKNWPWLDGAGGGGGYTKTIINLQPIVNYNYPIMIGSGGACGYSSTNTTTTGSAGGQTSFMNNTSNGGGGAYDYSHGGNGGSGGGSSNDYNSIYGDGGSDGSGGTGKYISTGQGTTTREFSESSGNLYSGGGAGTYGTGGNGGGGSSNSSGTMNTGGGSGSSFNNTNTGGSGIVVIRNTR